MDPLASDCFSLLRPFKSGQIFVQQDARQSRFASPGAAGATGGEGESCQRMGEEGKRAAGPNQRLPDFASEHFAFLGF